MPKADLARMKNLSESEEIQLLREQVRDLSEMNLALRRELQVHRERRHSVSSWESSEPDEDIVDPSQVHPQTGRVSVLSRGRTSIREDEDGENLLGDEPVVSPNGKLDREVKPADLAAAGINGETAISSALGKARPLRFLIFTLAFFFVIFVLMASSTSLGIISEALYGDQLQAMRDAAHSGHSEHAEHDSTDADSHDSDHPEHTPTTSSNEGNDASVMEPSGAQNGAHRRRLGGGVSVLLQNIAYCLTTCGVVAFFVGLCKQPLILGYLLGGVVVGPNLGLDLVHTHEAVSEIANLGLVFLLFMIGLELDVHEILRMGRVVLLTGLFQFPVCFGAQYLLFTGLNAIGLSLGTGQYAGMYCALVCAISSTMIVVKLLSEKGETERPNGRLTVGILIFQDIWAMVFLAIQPNLANPDLLTLCKQFGMIAALIILALGYAKFVMPAVLFFASRSVELMLVLSLSWCFFMGVTAHLPWVGVGMELAALIAGVALATFPYSAEFNGKIKYIRDFSLHSSSPH